LKNRKDITNETSSYVVRPEKTMSLESSKRKCKTSEAILDVKIQAASGLQLGQKMIAKKVAAAEVRRVPSAFDDDMIAERSRKGFFSCLWRDMRFDVHSRCTPGSENKFFDVETFSDDVAEV
jgi:hypothetical protein